MIISNYHEREIEHDPETGEAGFWYRGHYYILSDFMAFNPGPAPDDIGPYWHGYLTDSFFSAILVRMTAYNSLVIVGTYIKEG